MSSKNSDQNAHLDSQICVGCPPVVALDPSLPRVHRKDSDQTVQMFSLGTRM